MNLLILGATGRTGREIVDLALGRGHHVTAFVRSPDKIQRRDDRLRICAGDPLDAAGLAEALDGHDAVLSALGLPARQALRPSTRMTEFAATTVAAMKTSGVPRLAILSAAVLFPGRGLQYAFFAWMLKHHARDLVAMETVVRASELEWTIARPPRLVQSDDASYRQSRDALPEGSLAVSYRAVAAFMVDAIEHRDHVRETVGVNRAIGSSGGQ